MKIYQWLVLIFCLIAGVKIASAQAAKTNNIKPEIQNIKSKYKEFDAIMPIFVNNSDGPIYLLVHEGGKELSILEFDKVDKSWNTVLTNFYCGNDVYPSLEVRPGERIKLNFGWGLAWDFFKMDGLNKGKFKVVVHYRTPSMQTFEPVESRVFEYSVKKDPSFLKPVNKGNSE